MYNKMTLRNRSVILFYISLRKYITQPTASLHLPKIKLRWVDGERAEMPVALTFASFASHRARVTW